REQGLDPLTKAGRRWDRDRERGLGVRRRICPVVTGQGKAEKPAVDVDCRARHDPRVGDRKSTRLNSSHEWISYAVFCLEKKNKGQRAPATRGVRAGDGDDRPRGGAHPRTHTAHRYEG